MVLEKIKLALPQTCELVPGVFQDQRGEFVKTIQKSDFERIGLAGVFTETYYSKSGPSVLRGMHFQFPPFAHAKLVYCVHGRILDVVLDLRIGPSYGRTVSLELSAEKRNMIYVPPGCAHGFRTFDEPATVLCHMTSEYEPQADAGIRWDSFGFAWGLAEPVLSNRDQMLPGFDLFESPFSQAADSGGI